MIHTLLDNDRFFIFGHRGTSEFFPENTMASFSDSASDARVDGIELDVQLTRDGKVVIAHDFDLKRTAGIDAVVTDMTWNELSKIDVGSFKDPKFADQRIPLLEDLFTTFGSRFIYDIELKVKARGANKRLALAVWALIQKHGLEENVMVSSFNPLALRRFNRASWYSVPSGDIFEKFSPLYHFLSGAAYLKPEMSQMDVSLLEKTGLPAVVWTVNTAEDALRLSKIKGVRGLIGNNPHLLADVITGPDRK